MIRDQDPIRTSLLFALIATSAVVVVLKLITGLALAPLAIIAIVVLAIAFSLKLRTERMGVHARRQAPRG